MNASLAELGEQALEFESEAAAAAFGDTGVVDPEDDLQRITGAIYPQVRAELMIAHPWSWLKERQQLTERPWQEGEPFPASTWPYSRRYRLPNPYIANIRAVYDKNVGSTPRAEGWDVQSGYLYADFEVGYIEDQRDADETTWPQLFENAVVLALCARFAMPLKEDIETRRIYEQLAEKALNNATRVDAQSHPVAVIPRFDWEEARHGEFFGVRSHPVT